MSILTSHAIVRMRDALRKLGLTKLLAPLFQQGGYEWRFENALKGSIRPGDVVWDVGANVGHYTLKFASWTGSGGRIYAFEPSHRNFWRLREACTGKANVVICPFGLSSMTRLTQFENGADEFGATSRVVATEESVDAAHEEVELRGGDEAICEGAVETPDVIKIDVEGHELQVLKGVSDTLHGDRVRAIFVEVHFALLAAEGCGEAPREIERLLKSRGFAIRWPDPSHLHAFREGEPFFTARP
jgi:FkbM family methyltransferase